jgi:hypothetical protein
MPVPLGRLWCQQVNQPQSEVELDAIRQFVSRGSPFGGDCWQTKVSRQLGLEHTFRPADDRENSPRKRQLEQPGK